MANLPVNPQPQANDDPAVFYDTFATWMDGVESNLQVVENRVEATGVSLIGSGVIYGTPTVPLLSAGAGLSVNIGAFQAFIGFVVDMSAGGWNVGGLTPSATNYIYLRQDGSFTFNTTATNPGTTTNPAILLGTASTGTSTVTSTTDAYITVSLPTSAVRRDPFTAKTGGAAFDAASDRTGNACTVSLPYTPAAGTIQTVHLGRQWLVPLRDWTISSSTVTFLDGAKPQAGEIIHVDYVPAAVANVPGPKPRSLMVRPAVRPHRLPHVISGQRLRRMVR